LTSNTLFEALNTVTHSRESRQFFANKLLNKKHLIPKTLDILFQVDDVVSCRAAWVLEFMCREKPEALFPYLTDFTQNLNKIHLDAAVRPVAKICEYLAEAYYAKEYVLLKDKITPKHIECIVEVCFDYMINDEKIAPKAYAMNTLYLFGKDIDWIHPELKLLIERDYQMQSSGFKARARQILKKIKAAK